MIYRLADKEDAPQLVQMRWDFQMEEREIDPKYDRQAFFEECSEFVEAGISSNDWACWVAEENGDIVSHIYVRRIRKIPKPKRSWDEIGYVTNVYTKPQYRGKGIGKHLMEKVKEWAVECDLELLIVWPSERAVPFYEREGFSVKNEIMELILRED